MHISCMWIASQKDVEIIKIAYILIIYVQIFEWFEGN